MGFSFKKLFKREIKYQFNIDYNQVTAYVEGMDARELYSTQANLHAVISFISDAVAHLPLKVYERKSETERIRDRDSIVAKLLYRPNKDQTAYEFWNALVIEYLLYGEAIVMVLPDDSVSGFQLRLIPSEWITKRTYETNFAPSVLEVQTNGRGQRIEIAADNFVIFKMYNPGSPGSYQSPICSLKQTLSEQIQASIFRKQLWDQSGRANSYLSMEGSFPNKEARDAFKEAYASYVKSGSKAGSVPIFENGMKWVPFQFNAKEAQYAESIQLTREDVSAAYHVNPSLIWHTQTQTYASAKDNARALYADCLGPLLQMLQQRINSFLLPKIGANTNIYVEFDLEEKLKGSFEERASIYQSAAGVPYLTVNEVRAELNRPPVEGGDERVIPLNVLIGGQASPQDSTPDSYSNMYNSARLIQKAQSLIGQKNKLKVDTAANETEIKAFQDILEKFFRRQEKSISTKLKAVTNWWDAERWDRELKEDLLPILMSVSATLGRKIAKGLKAEYDEGNTENYLNMLAETRAHYINKNTYDALLEAQTTDRSVQDVFDKRILAAGTIATGLADTAKEFGTREAIEQAEYQGAISKPRVTKTWETGENPRDSHAAMDGETVDYDDTFSNGLRWPHDYGPEDETCGCNCTCSITIEY